MGNGHLPYPWGQHWRKERVDSWTQSVGGRWSKMCRRGEGKKVVSHSRVGSKDPLIIVGNNLKGLPLTDMRARQTFTCLW